MESTKDRGTEAEEQSFPLTPYIAFPEKPDTNKATSNPVQLINYIYS